MPNDPNRVQELFLQQVQLSPADRLVAMERECGDDAELRQRVAALLRASDTPDSYLDRPGEEVEVTMDSQAAGNEQSPHPSAPESQATTDHQREAAVGVVIGGRYTLQEKIGEGGMGDVWVARQTTPVKRKVALKLIKPGMDSRAVLQRFEQERQALALMDHPNIARVLDGGMSPTGQPYFVMELVNGLSLTKFCDAAKLTLRQRLELFMPICQAVQHAHQKGIVHRDLKPANILVTMIDGKPVPKVIDFGVAKATSGKLTEETMSTGFGAVVGTLEYMSPEQAGFSGNDIDTRSDIYSLGVILYELLTGLRPIDAVRLRKAALNEMVRIIQEEEPSKPSTRLSTDESLPTMAALRQTDPKKLMALLKGELDWVVMKCLEKQRDRRYDTANALVRDIQRYLADEIVEARAPSASYRFKKFVRRNKGQVLAASLVLVVLLAGIVGTTWGLFEARRQEQFARGETGEKERARLAEAERVKERDAALKAEGERADELKHRLGTSAMVLANAAYDSGDFKLAAERLDAVPAAQRGWEWRYLKRKLGGGIFTLYGHNGPVRSVAFSPDGMRVVTGSGEQNQPFEAKVWDGQTGALLFELKGLPQSLGSFPVVTAVFSADSTRIVTAGGDSTARIWDAATGALRLELTETAAEITCAAFSPDGARIATGVAAGPTGLVKLWDARTGEPVRHWRAHKRSVSQLEFCADGTRIFTGGQDGAVRVWDVGTGAAMHEAKGVTRWGCALAFSPDGTRIVAGRDDATARVIDARSGDVQFVLRGRPRESSSMRIFPMGVLGAAFSPDGTRIVTVGAPAGIGSGEAIVWDARSGAELLELKGHTGTVVAVAFSADGQQIMTGGYDGTAKLWDAQTGTPRLDLAGISSPVHSAAMSADGRWVVTGGGAFEKPGGAAVWDAKTGLPKFALEGFEGTVHSVAISHDGTRIVTGGGTGSSDLNTVPGEVIVIESGPPIVDPGTGEVRVWDAQTGEVLIELKGLKEPVGSVAISRDGTRIVTAGQRGIASRGGAELKLWDASAGTLLLDLTQPQHESTRMGERGGSVAFSPDGKRFVTGGVRHIGCLGNEVKVRDAKTGEALVTITRDDSVLGVAFSPDGTQIATANSDKSATVWDATTGAALVELEGHTSSVNSVAFSPDGTRLVTGGNDHTLRVWDARTGTTLAELRSGSGSVTSVSFSADGSQILASGHGTDGRSGEVFIWDAPTRGQGVEPLGHAGPIQAAVFSPDGTRVASGIQDGTVVVWDARTGSIVHELNGSKASNCLAFSADGTRLAVGGGVQTIKIWDCRAGTELIELNTGPVGRLAFAVDGTRIVTDSFDQTMKTWDAHTGQELTGEAIPKTVRCERTSPDGRYFVRLHEGRTEVVPLVPDPEEAAYRRLQTQPNPSRYRAGYLTARTAKDEFAAAFYLNLVPPDERQSVLEQGDSDAFAALNALAQEHQIAGKLDEALPLLVEILDVHKAKLGPENPATIEAADTLGRIYHQAGQFAKAVPLLEEVVKVRKAKQDPQTPNAQGMLGIAYKDAGRLKEAIAVLEEGAQDGWVRQQLLDVYALAGEHDRVITVCREQLDILRTAKDEGEVAYSKADLLARLGRAFLAQEKWADAETQLQECVSIQKKNWPDQWSGLEIQSLLGEALLRQQKYAEAEPLLLQGYQGLKQREYFLEPRDARRVPEALDRLIELYRATDKPEEVKKWQVELEKHVPTDTKGTR